MKIVIDISDNVYEGIKKLILSDENIVAVVNAFRKGAPLPKGHGRLIDADRVVAEAKGRMKYPENHQYMECVIAHMGLAPTIIEADKEGSDEDSN